jgi:hypothetical protein
VQAGEALNPQKDKLWGPKKQKKERKKERKE